MCKGMCKKSLQLQEDLIKKSEELNNLKVELETLWSMSFIYNTDRLLQLDDEINQKKIEISLIQSKLSTCKCYQAKCRLQGISYKIDETTTLATVA